MPKQEPIKVSQEEHDSMREQGYDKEGPRKGSDAANKQSEIGNVQKGDQYAQDQRRGMLAEVEEDEDDWWDTASKVGGAAAVAAGIGGLLFAGYKAYKHFTSTEGSRSSSTGTSQPNNSSSYRNEVPYRPIMYDTRLVSTKSNASDNHQEKFLKNINEDLSSKTVITNRACSNEDDWNAHILKLRQEGVHATSALSKLDDYEGKVMNNLNEDFSNPTKQVNKECLTPTLRLRQEADIKPTDTLAKVVEYKSFIGEDVKGDFGVATKILNEEQKVPTLILRQEVPQSADEHTKANDNNVGDVIKGEVFNAADKNLTVYSEKLQLNIPTDQSSQGAQAKNCTAIKDVKEDSKPAVKNCEEDCKKPKINVLSTDQSSEDALAKTCTAIEDVKEDSNQAVKNCEEDSEKPIVNLISTDQSSEDAQAITKDCNPVEDVKKVADKNGNEESETPPEEVVANVSDDDDFNGECAGKPDPATNTLRSG